MVSSSSRHGAERVHGGLRLAELRALGIDPTQVVDFSVNVNPFGPSPAMAKQLLEVPVDSYPDPEASAARAAVAAACGCEPDQVLIGNGASDLLWTLAQACGSRGCRALVAGPTFSEFAAACEALGGQVIAHSAHSKDDFALDLQRVARAAMAARADVVYLCSPNTPTGHCLPAAQISAFAADHPRLTVIVDQSFLSLSHHHRDTNVPFSDNAILLRSLTKDHGVPGLRMGYLIASAPRAARLAGLRPTWSVGSHVQAAIGVAMADTEFVATSRQRLLVETSALRDDLRSLGLSPLPSSTIFVCVDVGEGARVRERLLRERGLLVRDCASFSMPAHIRIAARGEDDRLRLKNALAAAL